MAEHSPVFTTLALAAAAADVFVVALAHARTHRIESGSVRAETKDGIVSSETKSQLPTFAFLMLSFFLSFFLSFSLPLPLPHYLSLSMSLSQSLSLSLALSILSLLSWSCLSVPCQPPPPLSLSLSLLCHRRFGCWFPPSLLPWSPYRPPRARDGRAFKRGR